RFAWCLCGMGRMGGYFIPGQRVAACVERGIARVGGAQPIHPLAAGGPAPARNRAVSAEWPAQGREDRIGLFAEALSKARGPVPAVRLVEVKRPFNIRYIEGPP